MRLVLGVGGGIAAYKSAELVRKLQQRGHDVQVVLTRAAQEFIRPLTFAALTAHRVITDLFTQTNSHDTLSSAVEHIAVARENDILLVAPATADLLAKFALGLADDFLSTLYLAFTGPVVLAPAMNSAMWAHPATQINLQTLRQRGCFLIEPEDGPLACGTVGPGRMADPERIASFVDSLIRGKRDLSGEVVLITAGPTQEPIDPVRYIGNRSSGKMGYAIAERAACRGASVILISGPVTLPPPNDVTFVSVRTTQEMREAVLAHLDEATIIIKAAAVADYYVSDVASQKLKKTDAPLVLELKPTPDILAEIGARKGNRLLIGFAAETEDLVRQARHKMVAKNCDMLVANRVDRPGLGFESDHNEVVILTASGKTVHAGPAEKREIADRILDEVVLLRLSVRSL
jgi:phosphopantothenoylcysteine decarboxylase/phosphopantothenate--cysteine ligase